MKADDYLDIQLLRRQAAVEAVADFILLGLNQVDAPPAVQQLLEDSQKKEIEAEVRKALKDELKDALEDALKKSLKGNKELEEMVVELTGKAMAKFFEILYTRRGTWQSQIKL